VIQQIYARIDQQAKEHSVKELCLLYNVSRSGYYKWLQRKGAINSFERAQQILDYYVSDIHTHYPSMGYRQIRDTLLLQTGWFVCDPMVWRSMKRLNIKGFIRKSNKPTSTGAEHVRYPNVLQRQFHADRPMQKIVTDVTYLKHHEKWYYLSCYMDLFNNEILEWELSDTFDNFLVITPVKRLLEKAESTGAPILLHSDQGVQYSSAGFCNLLKEYNVVQSMSKAGSPRDNAVMESFWGRFKDVLRRHYRYWEKDDLLSIVSDAIRYFNFIRPLRKLKGKPPVQYRIDLVV